MRGRIQLHENSGKEEATARSKADASINLIQTLKWALNNMSEKGENMPMNVP